MSSMVWARGPSFIYFICKVVALATDLWTEKIDKQTFNRLSNIALKDAYERYKGEGTDELSELFSHATIGESTDGNSAVGDLIDSIRKEAGEYMDTDVGRKRPRMT
jgi:hypothetical protein